MTFLTVDFSVPRRQRPQMVARFIHGGYYGTMGPRAYVKTVNFRGRKNTKFKEKT